MAHERLVALGLIMAALQAVPWTVQAGAISLYEDAYSGNLPIAASVFGNATCNGSPLTPCAAVSGTGNANGEWLDVSGTGGAGGPGCVDCIAISGTGPSTGSIAISVSGDAAGGIPFSLAGRCRDYFTSYVRCYDVSLWGTAQGYWVAISLGDHAACTNSVTVCVAASVTGDASCRQPCIALGGCSFLTYLGANRYCGEPDLPPL